MTAYEAWVAANYSAKLRRQVIGSLEPDLAIPDWVREELLGTLNGRSLLSNAAIVEMAAAMEVFRVPSPPEEEESNDAAQTG